MALGFMESECEEWVINLCNEIPMLNDPLAPSISPFLKATKFLMVRQRLEDASDLVPAPRRTLQLNENPTRFSKDSSNYASNTLGIEGGMFHRDLLSLRVIGRATRVWRATGWRDRDTSHATALPLKNYWLEQVAEKEGEIYHTIVDEPATITEKVATEDMPSSAHTRPLVHFPDTKHTTPLQTSEPTAAMKVTSEVPPSMTGRVRLHSGVQHRRVLFKEVGQCLEDAWNHRKVLSALIGVVHGLRVLYNAKYVHREISMGSVVLCGDQGTLADLEYIIPCEALMNIVNKDTQQFDPPSSKEFKTGTPAFMAVEIQDNFHYFLPHEEDSSVLASGVDWGNDLSESPLPPAALPQTQRPWRLAVIHNHLHNLESVWWMANYALFSSAPYCPVAPDLAEQRTLYQKLFQHMIGPCKPRYNHFMSDDEFIYNVGTALSISLRPSARHLVDMRQGLLLAYRALYQDGEVFRNDHRFLPLYEIFCQACSKAQEAARSLVQHINEVPNPLMFVTTPSEAGQAVCKDSTTGQKRKEDPPPRASGRQVKQRSPQTSQQPSGKENVPVRRSSRLANKSADNCE